MDKGGSRDNYK
jgi:E3 ubiquitin-protein ligase HERC4